MGGQCEASASLGAADQCDNHTELRFLCACITMSDGKQRGKNSSLGWQVLECAQNYNSVSLSLFVAVRFNCRSVAYSMWASRRWCSRLWPLYDWRVIQRESGGRKRIGLSPAKPETTRRAQTIACVDKQQTNATYTWMGQMGWVEGGKRGISAVNEWGKYGWCKDW